MEGDSGQAGVACGGYTIECTPRGLPLTYGSLGEHAALVDEIEVGPRPGRDNLCCFTLRRHGDKRPSLVVAQSYEPCGAGFEPGALLVPETSTVFLGAGQRVLAYSLDPPQRLWEDSVDCGFWGWEQHGDIVLALAELELAAWDTTGQKLWTTFVEPPWDITVHGNAVELDVMGRKSTFGLREGPANEGSRT
jgi:hypothetical protein